MNKLEAITRSQTRREPSRRHARRGREVATHEAIFWLAVLCIVAVATFSSGCRKPDRLGTRVLPSSDATTQSVAPIRLALMADQTRSMEKTWTEALKLEDVLSAVDVVKERGGDVVVLVVRSNSAKTPGPSLHIDPPQAIPVKPSSSDDVFDAADAAERHRRVVAAYDERNRKRLAGAEADISQFMTEVETLLHLKPDRLATDVGNAHARAARFFDDPDIPGQAPAERVLLAVSDGDDTAGLVPVKRFSRPVTVLLITPSGPGVFAIDKPIFFSSVPTAIRYLRQGGK